MIMSASHDTRSIGQRELVVLVALVMSLNALAIFIRNKFQRTW